MNKEGLISTINSLYAFDEKVAILNRIDKGYLSENHVLGNKKERFFLKKYRPFDIARLREIHSVKKFFTERGFPVIMPIASKAGKTFFKYQNDFYSIFPYLEGIQFERSKLSNKALRNCGKLLADIHLQTKDECLNIVSTRSFAWNKESFLNA